MKKLIAIVFVCSFLSVNAQPVQEWCNATTARLADFDINYDKARTELIIDQDGNLITVLTPTEENPSYIVIAKYNTSGELLWKHGLDNVEDYDLNVQQLLLDDANNLFIIGSRVLRIDSDVNYFLLLEEPYVQKVSPEGELLWEYNEEYEISRAGANICNAAVLDEDGNIYVVGTNVGVLDITDDNIILFSLDPNGSIRWNHFIEDGEGNDILLKDNQLYIVGKGESDETLQNDPKIQVRTFDKEGTLLSNIINLDYSFSYNESPKFDKEGNFYIAKKEGVFTLQKFDLNANFIWQYHKMNILPTTPSDISPDKIIDYIIDQDGSVYITGLHYSENEEENMLTVKLSPMGEIMWENYFNFNGQSKDLGHSLALFDDKKLLVVGQTDGETEESYDELLFVFNKNGQIIWDQALPNSSAPIDNYHYQCAIDNNAMYTFSFKKIDDVFFDQSLCKYMHNYTMNIDSGSTDVNSFYIFPNPAKDKITIQGIPSESIDQVQLFNAQGQLLLPNPDITDGSLEIPSSIPNGIYFLNVKVENSILQQKIIIQN